jgi:beta-lactamase regulating signal transducer with metallopeptidase domain
MMERAILEYVANSVWQVPMLAGMAWLAIRLGKPEVQMQHRVWIATLALSVVLPLIGHGVFPIRSWVEICAGHSHRSLTGETRRQAQSGLSGAEVMRLRERVPPVSRNGIANHGPSVPVFAMRLSQSAADWVLAIYFAIILLRLVQLAFARRTAGKLARRATGSTMSPVAQAILERCCSKLRVREPRVLMSDEIRTPMTVGVMRPALLLPQAFLGSTEREMSAILCHELAHVRRRDYLANWVCQLGSLPIAYHPAAYGMQLEIRRTRELVCDAMAAQAMDSSVDYARCLVTLAQRVRDGERLPQSIQAAGLFDHDVFEERIMRLLERKNAMSVRAKAVRMMGGIAVTAAVTIAAAVFHVTPVVVRAAQRNATAPRMAVAPQLATPAQIATPAQVAASADVAMMVQATDPAPASAPQMAETQTVHPAPIAPPANPTTRPMPSRPVAPEAARHGTMVRYHEEFDLTAEQRARLKADMAAARAQTQEATKKLQSPEFKKQMADMQAQVAAATKQLQSEEVQRQMKMLNSPEFKKQMADIQAQVFAATSKLESAEVQQQMKVLQSPEFKQQMAEMQRKIEEATRRLESDSLRMHTKELDRANRPDVQSSPKGSGPE